ncbi:DUF4236 domain-containing protein [Listeria costaricensis]|uniref:DUF4236 domain-containing protein n=1 Tax=Listeria costaricensis TaxID=2026604 RepID=UPI000C07E5C2|nr:DUF4236 domain-containing protein [Listeria costaricensis]
MRFRKSINLGGGFRVNISNSGVGYSWGVKGVRITKTARGTTRKTFTIPGTGISHVEETRRKQGKEQFHNGQHEYQSMQSTEIVNIEDYQSVEYKELLEQIKKVRFINLLSTVLIFTFIFAMTPIFILTSILGVILKIFVHIKLAVAMEYKFDEEANQSYENLRQIWLNMNENEKFWQIISEGEINKKTSGGASRGVNRIPAKVVTKLPYFIKANIKPFGLQLRKQKLFFMPDKLLVVCGLNVGAISYSDITMQLGTSNFIETDKVPKDAKVIQTTWLKVNKNGTPDKRFKENRQVPVCEYGKVQIKSADTLQIELMCSDSATIEKMQIFAEKVFDR